jgi:hypothetical protein
LRIAEGAYTFDGRVAMPPLREKSGSAKAMDAAKARPKAQVKMPPPVKIPYPSANKGT